MASHLMAIPIYGTALIHCAKVEDETPALWQGKIVDRSSVPKRLSRL